MRETQVEKSQKWRKGEQTEIQRKERDKETDKKRK